MMPLMCWISSHRILTGFVNPLASVRVIGLMELAVEFRDHV